MSFFIADTSWTQFIYELFATRITKEPLFFDSGGDKNSFEETFEYIQFADF